MSPSPGTTFGQQRPSRVPGLPTPARAHPPTAPPSAWRREPREEEIWGTAITCSGTEVSRCLKASTSCSPDCGTGTSRICTMGAKSESCSTVCRCTRSCGLGGSPRQGGRDPPGSSSYRLKSSGWGREFFRSLSVCFNSYFLHGPGRLLALVRKRGKGRSDRLLLVSPPRTQSSLLAPLSSSCNRLQASVHRERCHKKEWELLG